jgi:hypothetical protein
VARKLEADRVNGHGGCEQVEHGVQHHLLGREVAHALPRSNPKFDDIAQTIDVLKFHVMHRCSLYGFVMDQLHTFV